MNLPTLAQSTKQTVLPTFIFASFVGAATWVADVGGFVAYLAEKNGSQFYSIPSLIFSANVGRDDGLIVAVVWCISASTMYWDINRIVASRNTASLYGFYLQLILGSAFILLMLMSTVGRWSSSA
jgi:hypothetical protein